MEFFHQDRKGLGGSFLCGANAKAPAGSPCAAPSPLLRAKAASSKFSPTWCAADSAERKDRGLNMFPGFTKTDFARAVDFLIANETMTGPVNICSPNPLRNREFMRALRASWRQPVGLPAPAWMIEIGSFLLRTESELVLKSRRVIPGRLLNAGFSFTYPEWPAAAQELVARYRALR